MLNRKRISANEIPFCGWVEKAIDILCYCIWLKWKVWVSRSTTMKTTHTHSKKHSCKTCFGMTMDWHHQIVQNPILVLVAFVFWLGKTENNDIYFKFEINSAYSFVLIRPTLQFYGSNWTIPIDNFSGKMLSDIQKQTPKWWCQFDIKMSFCVCRIYAQTHQIKRQNMHHKTKKIHT